MRYAIALMLVGSSLASAQEVRAGMAIETGPNGTAVKVDGKPFYVPPPPWDDPKITFDQNGALICVDPALKLIVRAPTKSGISIGCEEPK